MIAKVTHYFNFGSILFPVDLAFCSVKIKKVVGTYRKSKVTCKKCLNKMEKVK
jgi:hypothetical protein